VSLFVIFAGIANATNAMHAIALEVLMTKCFFIFHNHRPVECWGDYAPVTGWECKKCGDRKVIQTYAKRKPDGGTLKQALNWLKEEVIK